MATPVRLQDGSVIDLDHIGYMNPQDKLDTIQAVLDRAYTDDADKWEADSGLCMDKIQTILSFMDPPN